MIPWGLYNLTARDQGSPLIRPYHETKTYSAIAGGTATQTHEFTVPNEMYLLLTAYTGYMEVNGTDRPLSFGVGMVDNDGSSGHWQDAQFYGEIARSDVQHMTFFRACSPLMLISSEEHLFMSATKQNVASNVWECAFSAAGVLIPRGTIALS